MKLIILILSVFFGPLAFAAPADASCLHGWGFSQWSQIGLLFLVPLIFGYCLGRGHQASRDASVLSESIDRHMRLRGRGP